MRTRLTSLTMLVFLACGPAKMPGAPSQHAGGPAPGVTTPQPTPAPVPSSGDLNKVLGPNASLLNSTFAINVTALGITVCDGNIQVKINAGFAQQQTAKLFDIPQGKIDCGLMGQVDLAGMLGSFSQSNTPQVQDPVVVENNVIEMKSVGGGIFSPPRPMLPSFIAASKDALATLKVTKQVTAFSSKDNKTSVGNVTVHTISFGQSYKSPKMTRTFPDVIDFEVVNDGFDGIDKISNFIFDRMEFKISLQPIAILSVSFTGSVADFMLAMNGGSGGLLPTGGLIGAITTGLTHLVDVDMKMDLVAQEGLDNQTTTDTGPGEVIGGKPSN